MVIGAAVIIRATENARKIITTTHPAAATIIALVALHTDQKIGSTRLSDLETKAEAGNVAQTAMNRDGVQPQNRLSPRSRPSRF